MGLVMKPHSGRRYLLIGLILASSLGIILVHRSRLDIRPYTARVTSHSPEWAKSWPEWPKKSESSTTMVKSPSRPHITAHKPPPPSSRPKRSIKPIAYVFPQFHSIPENDRLWGVNFTDWDNVRKYNTNRWDMDIIKPSADIGYYNLLDKSTRTWWTEFVRDIGLHGLIFHHYWFGDGHPVLHRVLEAMLADGQPDLPFMINWANHPWVSTWLAGKENTVLIEQLYGDASEWRVHFDWLLPFFRHKNYIRNGKGNLQFSVHNPEHMGDIGPLMFKAWKKWAVDEGIGELDIILTRIGDQNPNNHGPADAIGEFTPFPAGSDGTAQSRVNRLSPVYHHGSLVSWDNTPRHAPWNGDKAVPLRHPKLWKHELVESMRRIKADPNPVGEENFYFINALNEWAEGNALEPSMQWGTQWSEALTEAIAEAESLPWRDEMIDASDQIAATLEKGTEPVDVCVLIRAQETAWPFFINSPGDNQFHPPNPLNMLDMLRSLTAQHNERWRAVVFSTGGQVVDGRTEQFSVLQAWDPRIAWTQLDPNVLGPSVWPHLDVVDFVIEQWLPGWPQCANASHLLITTPRLTYSPTAFDVVSTDASKRSDIIGLNYMTPDSMKSLLPEPDSRDEFCTQLLSDWTPLCVSGPENKDARGQSLTRPLSTVLISQAKLRQSSLKLAKLGASHVARAEGSDAVVETGVIEGLRESGWTWETSVKVHNASVQDCHVLADRTWPTCNAKGWLWIHAPKGSKWKSGCHTFTEIERLYGEDPRIWDLDQWHEDGYCLRLSEASWREAMEED